MFHFRNFLTSSAEKLYSDVTFQPMKVLIVSSILILLYAAYRAIAKIYQEADN